MFPAAAMPLTPPAEPALDLAPENEAVALAAARAGDREAFAALFQRHYPAIHAFAYRLRLCPAEADDIAQETFVHAARSLHAYRGDASFKNWLFAIAANRGRDRHRQQIRRARLGEQLAALDETAAPDGGASARASRDNAHEAVRAALAALPPEHREAVALVYFENLSHAEAARVLGCAESTVSWRLFRAKSRLKHLLRARRASAHD